MGIAAYAMFGILTPGILLMVSLVRLLVYLMTQFISTLLTSKHLSPGRVKEANKLTLSISHGRF
jgi:hypothetical protein